MANYSICGIDCDACKFKTEQNCKGCKEIEGKVFWGTCELYACAASKELPHCGKCSNFPCQKLIEAHNGENPDGNGVEIENLKKM